MGSGVTGSGFPEAAAMGGAGVNRGLKRIKAGSEENDLNPPT